MVLFRTPRWRLNTGIFCGFGNVSASLAQHALVSFELTVKTIKWQSRSAWKWAKVTSDTCREWWEKIWWEMAVMSCLVFTYRYFLWRCFTPRNILNATGINFSRHTVRLVSDHIYFWVSTTWQKTTEIARQVETLAGELVRLWKHDTHLRLKSIRWHLCEFKLLL